MFLTKHARNKTAGLACMLTLSSLAIVAALPAAAKVLATVNGKQITDDDLKIAAGDLRTSLPPQLEGKARDSYLLDFLIDGELVAQKALAEKADQTPEFAKKLAYYREKLLMETVLEQVAKTAATDAAIKGTATRRPRRKPETAVHARLFLPPGRSQDGAETTHGGDEFATIAKEVSKDPLGRRRSRLVHQGPDGAGIRRCRVQAGGGVAFRSGEKSIRLAYHRDRGQATENLSALRPGQGASHPLCRAKGANRARRGLAQDREDRADRASGTPQSRQAFASKPRSGHLRARARQEIGAATVGP